MNDIHSAYVRAKQSKPFSCLRTSAGSTVTSRLSDKPGDAGSESDAAEEKTNI